jgi:hypothetical protein
MFRCYSLRRSGRGRGWTAVNVSVLQPAQVWQGQGAGGYGDVSVLQPVQGWQGLGC